MVTSPNKKDLPAFGVGPVLLSKHGRRPDFSSHPNGPQGMDLCYAFSAPGSENTFILEYLDDWGQEKVLDRLDARNNCRDPSL